MADIKQIFEVILLALCLLTVCVCYVMCVYVCVCVAHSECSHSVLPVGLVLCSTIQEVLHQHARVSDDSGALQYNAVRLRQRK